MLIVTEPKTFNLLSIYVRFTNPHVYVLNANVQGNQLNIFTPDIMRMYYSLPEEEKDAYFISSIFNDFSRFGLLIDKIMYPLYCGDDVILLIYNEEDIFNPATEALVKFIQQRYGYNYQWLESPEDFNQNDNSSFTAPGITNYDTDAAMYYDRINKYGRINPLESHP